MRGTILHRHLAAIGLVAASAAIFAAGFAFLASEGGIQTVIVEARESSLPVIPDTQPPPSPGDEAFRRPLFQRDRRAIDDGFDEAAPPPDVVASGSDIRVTGILINGSRARASLDLADGNAPVWSSVGDQLGGWTVDSITPERVRLRGGDEVVDLSLDEDR